jgi:hypothetical protein
MGTASFADPRAGLRLAVGLARWGRREGIASWNDLIGPVAA